MLTIAFAQVVYWNIQRFNRTPVRYGETKIIRDVSLLTKNNYDVLVIGGGLQGAAVFWEAALRGLSVVLVEQNDFASETSAQRLKVIYSDLRFLPQMNFKQGRTVTHERTTLMHIAPHLVHPMPVIVPTYGNALQSKASLGLAVHLDNWVNLDRSHTLDLQKVTPKGRVLSKAESLELISGLPAVGLKGAVLFHDAQVYNAERLVLAFLKSAAQIGGDLANYARVVDLLCDAHRVCGVKVLDLLTDQVFEVRARVVINTASEWASHLTQRHLHNEQTSAYMTATNIVTRPIFEDFAVGFRSRENSFFITPWHGQSLIGTHYASPEANSERALDDFLGKINRAYPPAALKREDVRLVQRGRLPVSDKNKPVIVDHRQDSAEGVFSVSSSQPTTVRHTAAVVLDHVFRFWGAEPAISASDTVPLRGGEMQSFSEYLNREIAVNTWKISESLLRSLIHNYGSEYPNVLDYLPVKPWSVNTIHERKAVLTAQIQHAVRKEMAVRLSDFIFRRSEIVTVDQLEPKILDFCAETMGKALNWDEARTRSELDEVYKNLRSTR